MAKKTIDKLEVNGENIITSLKIIKQVCEDNYKTSEGINCPFNVGDDDAECCHCGITDLEPCNWKILPYKRFQALG